MDSLPIVDFSGLGSSLAADQALAGELDAIFRGMGFCYFRNIGVSQELVDGLFAASARFHTQSEAAKRALAMNATHRGYMAPNTSVIVTSSVAKVKRPNYSESLMLMHEVTEDDPRYGSEVHGPNQWPDLPGFREAVQAYEAGMLAFCRRLRDRGCHRCRRSSRNRCRGAAHRDCPDRDDRDDRGFRRYVGDSHSGSSGGVEVG